MKTPNIGIVEKNLNGAAKILNTLLADEFVLAAKTRNFHWNVTGENFSELHKLFGAQYEELSDWIDELAERTRFLGAAAAGSLAEFSALTRLKECTGQIRASSFMIQNLLEDHETIIRSLREELDVCQNQFHDTGTADFLTGLMQWHEKTAWMLRASSGA